MSRCCIDASMPEVSFRPGEASDEQAILALLERSLGSARSLELHRWKHRESPFGLSYGRVAEVGGELVAWRALLRWTWCSGEHRVPAVRAVDTATDPGHRRRGLFSRLTRQLVEEARHEGAAFVFNTPGPQSLPGYLKLGWRVAGRVPLLVRPLHPMRAGWRLLTGSGDASGVRRPPSGTDSGVLAGFAPVKDLLAAEGLRELCEAAADDRRFSTTRTPDYLAWRYGAIPDFDYRALWALDSDAPAALIFHAGRRRGMCEIKIAEVLSMPAPASRRAASRLLRRLARAGGADYLVACAARRSPERSALLRAGFVSASRLGPRLTVLPLTAQASLPDPCNLPSWRCSLGDLEVF